MWLLTCWNCGEKLCLAMWNHTKSNVNVWMEVRNMMQSISNSKIKCIKVWWSFWLLSVSMLLRHIRRLHCCIGFDLEGEKSCSGLFFSRECEVRSSLMWVSAIQRKAYVPLADKHQRVPDLGRNRPENLKKKKKKIVKWRDKIASEAFLIKPTFLSFREQW